MSSSCKIYNLGTGRSFSVKNLTGLNDEEISQLSEKNFFVEVASVSSGSGHVGDSSYVNAFSNAELTAITKKYNNTTGILTISGGVLSSTVAVYQNGWSSKTGSANMYPTVYLVVGEIEVK